MSDISMDIIKLMQKHGLTGDELISAIENVFPCEVTGCTELAEYTGWYRCKDWTGRATGLIQKRSVCGGHTYMLIGGEE